MNMISEAAYRDDVTKLTPILRRFARALVQGHDVEMSDELVQGTLVKALAADQPRRGARLVIWLMSILTELHRVKVREVQSNKKIRSGEDVRHGSSHGEGEGWIGMRSAKQRDSALLGGIPLECREVLLLVTLENMSYIQVAETLGLPLNTVVSRLARAREHLSQSQRVALAPTLPVTYGQDSPSMQRAPYLRIVK